MLENIRSLEYSHPRLKICSNLPGMDSLISEIRSDRSGGAPLRQNISAVAEIMGRRWQSENYPSRGGIVTGIPRGGIHMGTGLSNVVPGYENVVTNHGLYRDKNAPIFQLGESN